MYDILPNIIQRSSWLLLRPIFKIFCSLRVSGIENIAGLSSNVIIASNHVSELDPLLVVASMPFSSKHLPFYFVTKRKDFYFGLGWKRHVYGGVLFKIMGAYPAISGFKDYEKALEQHLKFIRDDKSVYIFPSGKICKHGEIHKSHGGVGYLLKHGNIPVVPIFIEGAYKADFKRILLGKYKIAIHIGAPIYYKDLANQKHNEAEKKSNEYELLSENIVDKINQLT